MTDEILTPLPIGPFFRFPDGATGMAALANTDVQCGGPASCELLTHDQLTRDELMSQDYKPLPKPWQWLKDAKPSVGQVCEWVVLAPWGAEIGQGKWVEIDTDVNPDKHFWAAPGQRFEITGFRSEKGVAVFDPTFTAWREINQ